MIHCILLILLNLTATPKTDLLDSVKSDKQVIIDLKDVYRTYYINHIIDEQKENVNLYLHLDERNKLKDLLLANIKECEGLEKLFIANKIIKEHLLRYLSRTIRNYRILYKKGFESGDFKKDYTDYKIQRKAYLDFISSQFSMDKFIKLGEDEYWKRIDKKNYIKSKQYEVYEKVKGIDYLQGLKILDSLVAQTSEYQERSIYQIELADNYVKYYQHLNYDLDSSFNIAITHYRSVLDQKKYCLYLYESWVKWRSVTQKTFGASNSSEIPNKTYNEIRAQVAKVILDHIGENENNEMAINQFLVVATHDNVMRFGQYKYGNQNAVEFEELFQVLEQK
jgi:hypothetical protein